MNIIKYLAANCNYYVYSYCLSVIIIFINFAFYQNLMVTLQLHQPSLNATSREASTQGS